MPATISTGTNAVLRGMATPNGLPAVAWFEWGTTRAYGNRTAPLDAGSRSAIVFVTNQISGIALGRDYHFRLAVSNSASIVFGADQVFGRGKRVWAWGDNTYGQTDVPAGLTDVVSIAAGDEHSLALQSDGTVVGWGGNESGQASVPASLDEVVEIACGRGFSMALENDGTVVTWGLNDTNVSARLSNIVAIAACDEESLALKSDGTVAAWGRSPWGQACVPAGLSNVVAVAGGGGKVWPLKWTERYSVGATTTGAKSPYPPD